jgi:signal transduction histidine kinase
MGEISGRKPRSEPDLHPPRVAESFFQVLEDLSSTFARVSDREVGAEIEHWMERVDRSINLDRSVLMEFVPDKKGFRSIYQWTREGFPPMPVLFSEDVIPWIAAKLRKGETLALSSVRSLPLEAERDRQFALSALGPKAAVLVPLIINEKVLGAISFGDCHRERQWSPVLVRQLRLVANIFGNAMARQRSAMETNRLKEEAGQMARVTLLGEMAASIAHELNQPLAAILANAEAARALLDRDRPDLVEIKEILGDIVSDERRASNYLREVRTLFKKNPLQAETLDVTRILDEVALLMRSEMIIRKVLLQLQIEQDLPCILGDRVGIQQVMINLLRNAGDAVLEMQPSERIVTMRAFRQDSCWVGIAVSDTGKGVDKNYIGKIFDPFFSTKAEGIGMGLAIVRSIVESHGGEICARANSGPGATFEFTVPIAQAH